MNATLELPNVDRLVEDLFGWMIDLAEESTRDAGPNEPAAGRLTETASEALRQLHGQVSRACSAKGQPEPLPGEVLRFEECLRKGLERTTQRLNRPY